MILVRQRYRTSAALCVRRHYRDRVIASRAQQFWLNRERCVVCCDLLAEQFDRLSVPVWRLCCIIFAAYREMCAALSSVFWFGQFAERTNSAVSSCFAHIYWLKSRESQLRFYFQLSRSVVWGLTYVFDKIARFCLHGSVDFAIVIYYSI